MQNPNFFIGPMSKNIVDSIIEFSNTNNLKMGIIPSRRQIEKDGGYVNNWTTKEFCEYVRSRSSNILMVRDHSGPSQGSNEDDGIESFMEDCKYFDVIHVDVWKRHKEYHEGVKKTIEFIELGYSINPNLVYEVGTEESIRRFTPEEVASLIQDLRDNLDPKIFNQIKYVVIQSGTGLLMNSNIGKYEEERLLRMIEVVKSEGLIAKEHKGDYIGEDLIRSKFEKGLDCINIAPEFGKIETGVILDRILSEGREDLLDSFFNICLSSKKWEKWVSPDFDPHQNKLDLIRICGHYVFSDPDFLSIKRNFGGIDADIKDSLMDKLLLLLTAKEKKNMIALRRYFNRFSNKDITSLSEMFSEDVALKDWEIESNGKSNVVDSNQKIFDSVETIKVSLVSIYKKENCEDYSCEILIDVNGSEKLNVIDLISFDKSGLIEKVKAFKI
jgi:hypothetical protein